MNTLLSETLHVSAQELDAEGPADVAWVAVEDFSSFLVLLIRTVGTGGLDDFRILGNTAADGSGTDVVLADLSTAPESVTLSTIDAVNDTAMLEVSQADLDAAKSGETPLLGISASVGHVTGTDESVIVYIRGGARFQRALLTPQTVLA
jgi:hypothetical protein